MRRMTRIVVGAALASTSFAVPALDHDCLPFTQPTEFASARFEPPVRYKLEAALLRPQLEKLLTEHWGVQRVVWYADNHHTWPTYFELVAPSWDQLLENLLKPYQLRVALHPNHTAVVDYMPQATQP
ncbi:hypothetical protein CWE15_01060 [Aliidiomarina taiwanensis]|uniref:Toxin co-regulated pilus biosynthesis protein Q C-terminal domain-containing protein n=1 Tax=Aliidiomarina taiwanensis TaxID=946228 RepID=A0A432X920_9GAMM|nr:hypothetical protein [Aliidiomarina taiwanensis]RUO43820.1 hypothetical protein CWE15_01060 [Aliidiomarina taiwanensis]